jgi:hypothetical protein
MKTRYCLLAGVLMLGLATTAMATGTIGLFFDTDGSTVPAGRRNPAPSTTGYVLINNADLLVGGAAFKLESEGGFMLVGETWADGLLFGTLLTGAEIGLYTAARRSSASDPTVDLPPSSCSAPTMIDQLAPDHRRRPGLRHADAGRQQRRPSCSRPTA